MKEIFKAIAAQLDTVTELRWVDEDKGQMNFERPPVAFPAALITISLPNTNNLNLRKQHAVVQVGVKLCFDFGGNTSSVTPMASRDESLKYYDITEKVYAALQGWATPLFNPLERRNLSHEKRPDIFKVVNMTFSTEFHDFTAAEHRP